MGTGCSDLGYKIPVVTAMNGGDLGDGGDGGGDLGDGGEDVGDGGDNGGEDGGDDVGDGVMMAVVTIELDKNTASRLVLLCCTR